VGIKESNSTELQGAGHLVTVSLLRTYVETRDARRRFINELTLSAGQTFGVYLQLSGSSDLRQINLHVGIGSV